VVHIPFNLIDRAWLPVRRASGEREIIRPSSLTDNLDDDPIVGPDWGRADLDGATLELLIGLLAVACPPHDGDDWLDRWNVPPSPDGLDAALRPLAKFFNLDGKGALFMQDLEPLQGEMTPVEALFIEAPGANARKLNRDLFEKRDRLRHLSRPAAAIALFALQAFAPAGGAGHRTSLRGGGPLTSLVVPGPRRDGAALSLWYMLWANVPRGQSVKAKEFGRIFPWTAPTRVSDQGLLTTAEDVHPLQAFFGMPRRIRLVLEDSNERSCDLTGLRDDRLVTGFVMRPRGTNYGAFEHPLTPYYRLKPQATEWLPVHAPTGHIGYRQWLSLVLGNDAKSPTRIPARCVTAFFADRVQDIEEPARRGARLYCAGYAMDNMKALDFTEAEIPLHSLADLAARNRLRDLAQRLVDSANLVAGLLVVAVRRALYGDGPKIDADTTVLSSVRENLWDKTENAFHDRLHTASLKLNADGSTGDLALVELSWAQELRNVALDLFDSRVPLDSFVSLDPRMIVDARRSLVLSLLGFGKGGIEFFRALGLPPRETASSKRRRTKGAVA
jgi:CRISPR system Cascade subunit CasA